MDQDTFVILRLPKDAPHERLTYGDENDEVEDPSSVYWPGRFIPFPGGDLSPEAAVQLHQMCEKCLVIRDWIEENLQPAITRKVFAHHDSIPEVQKSAQ